MIQSTFAALLMGKVSMPPPPAEAVQVVSMDRNRKVVLAQEPLAKPKPTTNAGLESEEMKQYHARRKLEVLANRKAVLDAVAAGYGLMADITIQSQVGRSTAHAMLHEMKADGLVEQIKHGRGDKWLRTEKPIPHGYFTAPRHTPASGQDPIPEAGKDVIDGEGV